MSRKQRKGVKLAELQKLGRKMLADRNDALELERQLDALPPELRPMRGVFAATIAGMSGKPGHQQVAAASAYRMVDAHLRRQQIRRVK